MNKIKTNRNGGRPRKTKFEKRTERISFRVGQMEKKVIAAKVKEAQISMAEFLRRAVKNAEITPAEYENFFAQIDKFDATKLIELIAVSATVEQPLSYEELKVLNDLYRFAIDINALVKRGNATLSGKEQIDYVKEMNRLKQDFMVIKDYFLRVIVGD